MNKIKAIGVFLASTFGNNLAYTTAARDLGAELAQRKLQLVYGGGCLGLMGVLADSVLENGGEVIGVIPTALYEKEVHPGLPELHVVTSMQARKAMMTDLSDAFITLPGGLGTFEELFEVWSAAKIGLHQKPVGLLNIHNYYDKLLEFTNATIEQGFMNQIHLDMMAVAKTPAKLLDQLQQLPKEIYFVA